MIEIRKEDDLEIARDRAFNDPRPICRDIIIEPADSCGYSISNNSQSRPLTSS